MDKTKDIAFINFNTLQFGNIFKTQVLNWIRVYEEYGIKFDLVMFKSIKLLFNKKQTELDYIKNNFHNNLHYIYLLKPESFISKVYSVFLFYLILSKYRSKKKIIIQIRSPQYYFIFLLLKRIFRDKIKLIYDCRAIQAEEKRYIQNKKNGYYNKKIFQKLKKTEFEMINVSDLVFCVSNALKNYHIQNNPSLIKSRFFVSPCAADSDIFYYSFKKRNYFRNKLSVNDKKVFVYSGGLEMLWHIPDYLFNFFKKIKEIIYNSFFLILTNDHDIAQKYVEKYNILINDVCITSVDNYEVCNYLNASDISLLFREDVSMNNVASPTKFAEYLMTGLPVIISENIGDYSNFVNKNKCGYVLPYNYAKKHLTDINLFLSSNNEYNREIISKIGEKHFSKKMNIDKKVKKYYSLVE